MRRESPTTTKEEEEPGQAPSLDAGEVPDTHGEGGGEEGAGSSALCSLSRDTVCRNEEKFIRINKRLLKLSLLVWGQSYRQTH